MFINADVGDMTEDTIVGVCSDTCVEFALVFLTAC